MRHVVGVHSTRRGGRHLRFQQIGGRLPSLPAGNNWGIVVDGDTDLDGQPLASAGPGSATYYLTADECATSVLKTTTSNEMVVADLYKTSPALKGGPDDPSNRPPCAADGDADPPSSDPQPPGPPNPPEVVGMPVSVTTGNVYLDQKDAVVNGVHGLKLTRSYNSKNAAVTLAGTLGRGWSHSYDIRVNFFSPGVIVLRKGSGVSAFFQDGNNDLRYDASVPLTEASWIEFSDPHFIRRFPGGGSQRFSITTGRLLSIRDAVGSETVLHYDASDRLDSVTDPGGRALTFQYHPVTGALWTLTGPSGVLATYTYLNQAGGSLALDTVTYADGSGYSFTYNENAELLTVSDHSERVLETHTYEAGRGITSEISDGREKYTLSYGPFETTTTDALERVTKYAWTYVQGLKRVTNVTGLCSCGSGGGDKTQEWSYDTLGRIEKYRDGANNEFGYEYYRDHRIKKMIEPGTPTRETSLRITRTGGSGRSRGPTGG